MICWVVFVSYTGWVGILFFVVLVWHVGRCVCAYWVTSVCFIKSCLYVSIDGGCIQAFYQNVNNTVPMTTRTCFNEMTTTRFWYDTTWCFLPLNRSLITWNSSSCSMKIQIVQKPQTESPYPSFCATVYQPSLNSVRPRRTSTRPESCMCKFATKGSTFVTLWRGVGVVPLLWEIHEEGLDEYYDYLR